MVGAHFEKIENKHGADLQSRRSSTLLDRYNMVYNSSFEYVERKSNSCGNKGLLCD